VTGAIEGAERAREAVSQAKSRWPHKLAGSGVALIRDRAKGARLVGARSNVT
jgi:hypothetical protein